MIPLRLNLISAPPRLRASDLTSAFDFHLSTGNVFVSSFRSLCTLCRRLLQQGRSGNSFFDLLRASLHSLRRCVIFCFSLVFARHSPLSSMTDRLPL
jgi:hypothetical protein